MTYDKYDKYGKYGKAGCVADGRVARYWIAGLNGFIACTCDDQIYIYDAETLRICFITRHYPSKISSFDGCQKYLIAAIDNTLYYTERLKINEVNTTHDNPIIGCNIVGSHIISHSATKLVITSKNENGDFVESFSTAVENVSLIVPLKAIEDTILICKDSATPLCLFDISNYKECPLNYFKTCGLKFINSSQSAQAGIIALLTCTSQIIILDILSDELLISLQLEDVSSICFVEKDDSEFLVISTNTSGLLSILNLETRVIEYTFNTSILQVNQLVYCEKFNVVMAIGSNSIISLKSNSQENFFKIEKHRKGHPSVITYIQHYGDEGLELLTCSEKDGKCYLGITSTIQQQQSTLFSTKSFGKHDDGTSIDNVLRPIKLLCVSYIRRFDWPNIITCHESTHQVHIWSGLARSHSGKCLELPDNRSHATAILLSSCGNHAIVGYKNGVLYKFNLQSAMPVGSFTTDKNADSAHTSSVIGLFHGHNDSFSSISKYYEDNMIKVWDLKQRKLLFTYNLDMPKSSHILIAIQQTNGFLSAYLTNSNNILVVDVSIKSTFRDFTPSIQNITSMCFHPNTKWILYCNNHNLIIYDILISAEAKKFRFENAIKTILPSLDGTFINISHANSVGTIYIYTSNYNDHDDSALSVDLLDSSGMDLTDSFELNTKAKNLMSLSGVKLGILESILMHDEISKRNTPKNVKSPVELPFFLPTEYKDGSLVFVKPKKKINKKDKLGKIGVNETFLDLLNAGKYDKIFDYLKTQSPAAIHLIFSCEMESDDVKKVLEFFIMVAKSKDSYDLCQIYLSIFIKYNVQSLLDESVRPLVEELQSILQTDWDYLRDEFEAISCYLKFFAHI